MDRAKQVGIYDGHVFDTPQLKLATIDLTLYSLKVKTTCLQADTGAKMISSAFQSLQKDR